MNKFAKTLTGFVLFAAVISGSVSCNKTKDCFSQHSDYGNRVIDLEKFSIIRTQSYFDVTIYQDSSKQLIIHGPSQLIKKVSAEIMGEELVMANTDPCYFLKNPDDVIQLEFHIPDTDSLFFDTYAKLQIPDTFFTDTLKIHFGGKLGECDIKFNSKRAVFVSFNEHGVFNITGTCGGFTCASVRGGVINADSLDCSWVVARNYGRSDMRVAARNTLLADIYGAGNIYYRFSPSRLELSDYGSGKLIPLN